jgi:cell division protein FtsB
METELEGQPVDRNKALEEKIKLLQKENELLKSKAKVSLCEYMFCRNSRMDK